MAICNICRPVKTRDAPHWWWFRWWCGKRLNVDLLLWCSLLHWQSICKGSYNGFSLLSPNPGGETQRRCVPKDRHGCEEAETRHRGKRAFVAGWQFVSCSLDSTFWSPCASFSCRSSQARAMLGQSTWLRSKSTKPTSVATTIRPGLWSSRFQKADVKRQCFEGKNHLGEALGGPANPDLLILPVQVTFHTQSFTNCLDWQTVFPFCIVFVLLVICWTLLIWSGVKRYFRNIRSHLSGLSWGSWILEFDLIVKSRCQINIHCPFMCGVVPQLH